MSYEWLFVMRQKGGKAKYVVCSSLMYPKEPRPGDDMRCHYQSPSPLTTLNTWYCPSTVYMLLTCFFHVCCTSFVPSAVVVHATCKLIAIVPAWRSLQAELWFGRTRPLEICTSKHSISLKHYYLLTKEQWFSWQKYMQVFTL